jgi:hypothetical protein
MKLGSKLTAMGFDRVRITKDDSFNVNDMAGKRDDENRRL